MSCKQTTLCAPISFCGKGLHTGLQVAMTVKPAPADKGIVFKRIDIKGAPEVPALGTYVSDTARGTSIKSGRTKISTIEHIMSALWNMGVDNAVVELNAPETPIMDGSAKAYAEAIAAVGLTTLDADRQYFDIPERTVFSIPKKGVEIVVEPASEFSVDVTVDYDSKVIGVQSASFVEGDDFKNEIASCRTFVFLHEIEPLLKLNLIKGGDVENAIVVVEKNISDRSLRHLSKVFGRSDIQIENGYLNHLVLRFPNEIARHKLLDILGDLALFGMRIRGKVTALRPGHMANTQTVLMLNKLKDKQ